MLSPFCLPWHWGGLRKKCTGHKMFHLSLYLLFETFLPPKNSQWAKLEIRTHLTSHSHKLPLLMSALKENWKVQTAAKSPIIKIGSATLLVVTYGHLDGWVDTDRDGYTDGRTEMVEHKKRIFVRASKSKAVPLHHCSQSWGCTQPLAQPYWVSGWMCGTEAGCAVTMAVNQTRVILLI